MISNKFVIFMLFVVKACYGLEAPVLKSVTVTDDDGLFVIWEPVNSTSDGAILGYKIIISEVKEKTERMFKLVNADQEPGLVKESISDEVFEAMPIKLGKQILAEGANTDNIVVDYVKPDVLYEIRALAYTKDKESKLSRPWRVKLLKSSMIKVQANRHTDECFLAIRKNHITSELPEIYNNFI